MFKFSVEVDLSGMEKGLLERFGDGSEAQRFWSEIVFNGSTDYMPMVTGTFIALSRIVSTPLFEHGELLYPTVYAHYLWEGRLYVDPETRSAWARAGVTKVPANAGLEYNQAANPLAGARWVERAANDNLPTWVEAMQRAVDAGRI